mgnify:CR=1 FL=1
MKKTILKRSVASTLSFLMAFSSAVPSSVVYAEESGIESEIAKDYVATLSQTQNGTTSFVTDGNKTQAPATHAQGDKVEVAVEPKEGFNATKIATIKLVIYDNSYRIWCIWISLVKRNSMFSFFDI